MGKQVKQEQKKGGAVGTAMLPDPLIDTTSAAVVVAMVKAGREATEILAVLFPAERTVLCEADAIANGQPALDWGFPDIPPIPLNGLSSAYYTAHIGSTTNAANRALLAAFTNTFPRYASPVPAPVAPIGGIVRDARPALRWRMPDRLAGDPPPAFAVEIRKGGTNGLPALASGPLAAPPRDISGAFAWEIPVTPGSRFPSGVVFDTGAVYAWRVAALSSKFHDGDRASWSDWSLFRLADARGEVTARVRYYGAAIDGGTVTVRAYADPFFGGSPALEYAAATAEFPFILTDVAVPFTLRGATGISYLMAFIDLNGNGVRDAWESWGYASKASPMEWPHIPAPVPESGTVGIIISDADIDQDRYPDAWEWQEAQKVGWPMDRFLERVGPVSGTSLYPEINPTLLLTVD